MTRIRLSYLAAIAVLISGCGTDQAAIPVAVESEGEASEGLTATFADAEWVAAKIDPTLEGYPDYLVPSETPPLVSTALTKLGDLRIDKEDFSDPLSGWKSRIIARKCNLENYYVMIGECFNGPLSEDCRGNNLDGIWMHDGDLNCTDVFIRFETDFGRTINTISFDLGNHTTEAYVTIYDLDFQILLHEEIPPGCCFCAYPPGSGGENIYAHFEVSSNNGVAGFDVTSQEHVKGNVGIDNIVLVRGAQNLPPMATASGDQMIPCAPPEGASVVFDGSASIDPEGGVLDYAWLIAGELIATGMNPTVTLPIGTHRIELIVEDDHANTHTDSFTVTILADEAPVITLLGDNPVLLDCHEEYVEAGVSISDECDEDPALEILGTVDPTSPGSYVLTYVVTDAAGNTASVDRLVEVADTSPPEVVMTIEQTNLWPPNNKLRRVISGITANDGCDGAPTVAIDITMETHMKLHRTACRRWHPKQPDWKVVEREDGTFDVFVRATWGGFGRERIYTISVTATDDAGYETSQEVIVTVARPHGKRWPWQH